MPLMGGMTWTETSSDETHRPDTTLHIYIKPCVDDGVMYPAEHISLSHENATRLYRLLTVTVGPQSTDANKVDTQQV